MIVGWDHLEALALGRSVVTIQAPASTGKRTAAEAFARAQGVQALDVISFTSHPITADEARQVTELNLRAPLGPGGKYVIARLSGASEQAQNILLKTLEEPHPSTHFLLLCTDAPLATILSRSQSVVRRGQLEADEVEAVLVQRLQMTAEMAQRVRQAGGIRQALEWAETAEARAMAMSAGRAVLTGDVDLLRRALEGWNANAHRYLKEWCAETITGRARVFNEAELGKDKNVAGKLSRALEASVAAPKLAASAVCHGVCETVRT